MASSDSEHWISCNPAAPVAFRKWRKVTPTVFLISKVRNGTAICSMRPKRPHSRFILSAAGGLPEGWQQGVGHSAPNAPGIGAGRQMSASSGGCVSHHDFQRTKNGPITGARSEEQRGG